MMYRKLFMFGMGLGLWLCSFQSVNAKTLLFPEVIQEKSQWCWSAVAGSLLQFYGHTVSQCKIADYARTVATWHDFGKVDCCVDPDQGCDYWNYSGAHKGSIQDIIQNFGNIGANDYYQKFTQTQVENEINTHSRPFVARWGWTSGGGHFVVVYGIENDVLTYMNPWFGEGVKTGKYDWFLSNSQHQWTHSMLITTTCSCTAVNDCCDGCNYRNEGSTCDDKNACTQTSTCQAGRCVGSEPISCKGNSPCMQDGACDPQTGKCIDLPKPNGFACDDGDACTQKDFCRDGQCVGGRPVLCEGGDQCTDAGVCDPKTGRCTPQSKPDGTTCEDKNPCTTNDVCQAGSCKGTPMVCKALDQCHQAGVCDPQTGQCSNPAKDDGTSCDDGNACTIKDSCQAGQCVGWGSIQCQPLDQCHQAGVCDPQTGLCSHPTKDDGTSCDDENACTHNDACQAGVCKGDALVCKPLNQCHEAGVCNPQTGLCSEPLKGDGTTCSEGVCTKGQCAPPPACSGCQTKDATSPQSLGLYMLLLLFLLRLRGNRITSKERGSS